MKIRLQQRHFCRTDN